MVEQVWVLENFHDDLGWSFLGKWLKYSPSTPEEPEHPYSGGDCLIREQEG